jgi:hypothetical protein
MDKRAYKRTENSKTGSGRFYCFEIPLMPMMIIMGMISFTITPAEHTTTDSNDKDD